MVSLALAECESVDLIRTYFIEGKQYLEIQRFNQRVRSVTSKYPDPSSCQQSAAVRRSPPQSAAVGGDPPHIAASRARTSPSPTTSSTQGEYEGDLDLDARFAAFKQRHPGVKTRHGDCRAQYIGLVMQNGSPHHQADLLDSKQLKWIDYWQSSKAPPLGLLNYLAGGDCIQDPPEIDSTPECMRGV